MLGDTCGGRCGGSVFVRWGSPFSDLPTSFSIVTLACSLVVHMFYSVVIHYTLVFLLQTPWSSCVSSC